jgi:hypothetical protein
MRANIKLSYDSYRGQCVILLLAALSDLGGKSTKRDVLEYIARRHFFEMEGEDPLPFPTGQATEPRWELLLRYASGACVNGRCIREGDDGSWELTPTGRELYSRTSDLLRNGTYDLHRCFLWTPAFKSRMSPDYTPRANEPHRPAGFYQYLERQLSALAVA